MGIFYDIKAKGAAYRLTEEAIYAEAFRELESGQRRDGIWAKAMADSDMDHGKAGGKYIKLRVQSLKDEITVFMAELNRVAAESQTNSFPQSSAELPQQKLGTRLFGVLVVFIAICGFGYYVYTSRLNAANLSAQYIAAADEGQDAHARSKANPTYLPLDNMIVNLADQGGEKVAMIGITLEIRDVQLVGAVKAASPMIRTSVMNLIAQRTEAELLSMAGKKKLVEDILEDSSVPFGGKADYPIVAVLFHSFIVQ